MKTRFLWTGLTLLACMGMLVGGGSWLSQARHDMSEAKSERVHGDATGLRMAWEGLTGDAASAPPPVARSNAPSSAAAARKWTIALVLPRAEQNDEWAFRQYLSRHHRKLDFVPLFFSGRPEDGATLIAQLRALQPDLIYSWGTPTTLAIAGRYDAPDNDGYIRDIPIVFAEVTDPVGAGLLPSLTTPGRNVTGVPHVAPLATQLALLNAYRPFKKIGFINNPLEPNSGLLLAQLIHASTGTAQTGPFQVLSEELRTDGNGQIGVGQITAAVHRLKAAGAQVLYVGASTLLAFTYRDVLTGAALREDLPTFCTTESILRKADCLFGIFSDGGNIGQYAAYKADRILTGTQTPQDTPADPLQRFSILINMPVAQQLNLYPPLALLPVAEVVTGRLATEIASQ